MRRTSSRTRRARALASLAVRVSALRDGLVVAADVAGAELHALGGAVEDDEAHEAQGLHEVRREEYLVVDQLVVWVDDAEVVQEDGVVLREGR